MMISDEDVLYNYPLPPVLKRTYKIIHKLPDVPTSSFLYNLKEIDEFVERPFVCSYCNLGYFTSENHEMNDY